MNKNPYPAWYLPLKMGDNNYRLHIVRGVWPI